ncbi:MAG: polysaccharide deacetylase family protein [Methylococcaceae bacterium]|nr:polysaccharide deacetylase family protein [Methylococcaceae bacterium]
MQSQPSNKQPPKGWTIGITVSRLRIGLKRIINYGAAWLGWVHGGRNPISGLRILLYHRVNPYPFDQLSMTSREISVAPEQFEQQLAYLQSAGFKAIGLDLLERFLSGKESVDKKCVLITFDDGYEDNLLWAAPLLKKYGFTAVFLVVSGFMEQGVAENLWYEEGSPEEYRKFLVWQQVKALKDMGFGIGSHSVSHSDLNQLNAEDLQLELQSSKVIMEKNLGISVTSLAYPRGIYNDQIILAAQNAGYQTAFTTEPGINPQNMSTMALHRTEISASDTLFLFKQKMAGNLDWFDFKKLVGVRTLIDRINKFFIFTLQNKKKG